MPSREDIHEVISHHGVN